MYLPIMQLKRKRPRLVRPNRIYDECIKTYEQGRHVSGYATNMLLIVGLLAGTIVGCAKKNQEQSKVTAATSTSATEVTRLQQQSGSDARRTSGGIPGAGTHEGSDELVVILDPSVSKETLQYLSSISRTRVHVTRAKESIATVSKTELGRVGAYTNTLCSLNSQILRYTTCSDIGSELPGGTTVQVPDLHPPTSSISTKLQPGTSVAQLALPFYGYDGPKTLERIEDANPTISSLDSVPADATVIFPDVPSVQVLRLLPGVDANAVLNKLQSLPDIQFASRNIRSSLEKPVTISQSLLASSGSKYDIEHLDEKWFAHWIAADKITKDDMNLTGQVVIAVLDSGLDFSHPDFANNLWTNSAQSESLMHRGEHGYDFARQSDIPTDTLPDSHGTHIAGIVSARMLGKWFQPFSSNVLDNHIKLMILRVATEDEAVSVDAIMSAVQYAQANGARIVSGSWSTVESDPLRDYLSRYSGLLLIVAAGNGQQKEYQGSMINVGQDIDRNPEYPSSFRLENMISVGAFDPGDQRAFFSNFGSGTVNVLAPGVNVESTIRSSMVLNKEPYGSLSGTSQATPFVTFAAGVLFAKNNLLSSTAVRDRILDTLEMDPETLKSSGGKLNLLKAIAIDEDLVELNDKAGSIIRGRIATPDVRFIEDGVNCNSAKRLNVSTDRVGRVLVAFDGQSSLIFTRDQRIRAKVCNTTIDIRTNAGVITKNISEIRDLVWRGVRGRSLGY